MFVYCSQPLAFGLYAGTPYPLWTIRAVANILFTSSWHPRYKAVLGWRVMLMWLLLAPSHCCWMRKGALKRLHLEAGAGWASRPEVPFKNWYCKWLPTWSVPKIGPCSQYAWEFHTCLRKLGPRSCWNSVGIVHLMSLRLWKSQPILLVVSSLYIHSYTNTLAFTRASLELRSVF